MHPQDLRHRAGALRDWTADRAAHGRRVVYFHVPKCGGRSIRAALRASFSVAGLHVAELDPRASRQIAQGLGEPVLDSRERWLLYQVVHGRARLVAGHMAFSPLVRTLSPYDWTLLTVLRDPMAHLFSQYFYNRDKPDRTHVTVEPGTTVKEFLASPVAQEIGASFVSHFADRTLRAVPTSDEALESAVANLRTVDAVGTLEHLDRWVEEVACLTGRRLRVGRSNVNPTSHARQDAELDDEAREMASEVCRPNRRLYARLFGEDAVPRRG